MNIEQLRALRNKMLKFTDPEDLILVANINTLTER